MPVSNLQTFFEKMPEEKTGSTKPRSLGLLLVFSVVVFFLVNLGLLTIMQNYMPGLGTYLVVAKWELLLNQDQDADVLILGDSTANQGLVAEMIEDETGLRAMNYGTVANLTTLNDVWMLNEYLEKHEPPKLIIVMHSYQMWSRELSERATSLIPFFQVSDWREVFQPNPSMTFVDMVEQRVLYYVAAYTRSHTIRTTIRTVLQVPPDLSMFSQQTYSISSLGTYREDSTPAEYVQEDVDEHLAYLARRVPFIAEESLAGLDALQKVAEEHGINVVLLNAPLAEEVATDPMFRIYFDPIREYLSDFAENHANFYYVYDEVGFPKEEMASADHMLWTAATQYTELVIKEILPALGITY